MFIYLSVLIKYILYFVVVVDNWCYVEYFQIVDVLRFRPFGKILKI
jgi:hypothetical protein